MAPGPLDELARECRPHSIIPRDDTCLPDESYLQQLEEPGFFDDLTRVCKPESLPPESLSPVGGADTVTGVAIARETSGAAVVTGIAAYRRQEMRSPPRAGEDPSGEALNLGISDAEMKRFQEEADLEDAAHAAVIGRMAKLSQITALVVMVIYFMSAVFFYMYVEDWTFLEGLYFVVVTVTTVGYGNLVPKTNTGKWFTCLFVFTYVGLIGVAFGMREASLIGATKHVKRDPKELETVGYQDETAREDKSKVCFDAGKVAGWKKNCKIVVLAFSPLTFVIFSGTFFYMSENELSFTDAIYFSCVSQTTVGFGEISPVTQNGRIFALFWLFAGVIVVGWSIQTLGAMFLKRQLKAIQRENLSKKINIKDLLRWGGEDGKLDRNEFALAKLIAQSKISQQDVDDINKQFVEMDEDGSGLLDIYDILASKRDQRTESFVGAARELTTTQMTQMAQSAGEKGTVLFADHWFRHA